MASLGRLIRNRSIKKKIDYFVNENNFSHMEDFAKLLNSKVISIERKRNTEIEKLYVVRINKKDSKIIILSI